MKSNRGEYIAIQDLWPSAEFFKNTLEIIINQFAPEAIKQVFKEKKCSILDVGAGKGTLVETLRADGYKAVGVDYNSLSAQPGAKGAMVRGDVNALPFTDGSFDIIVSAGLLDAAKYKNDLRQIASELSRVLKPGGIYVTQDLAAYGVSVKDFQDQFTVVDVYGAPRMLIKK